MRNPTAAPILAMLLASISSTAIAQLSVSAPNASLDAAAASSPVERVVSRMANPQSAESRSQIRARIRYVMVDRETRNKIYAGLGSKPLRRIPPTLPDESAIEASTAHLPDLSSRRTTRLSGATTCVLNDEQVRTMLATLAKSPACEVRPAPTIFLLPGKPAEMNDTTQHPFVIDMREDARVREPVVKILDVGTQLRVQCTVDESRGPWFEITAELTCSRIESIETETIFGMADEPVEVQRPLHTSNRTRVTESISTGNVLMIDPHFWFAKVIHRETPMPMVGKLPYVGQSFRNSQDIEIQQYIILLIEPGLLKQ